MLLGCFVSAQQARSESVFQAERAGSLSRLVLQAPVLSDGPSAGDGAGGLSYAGLSGDTTTTAVDIEVPESGGHHHYKEIIGIVIAAAVITYAAITILAPDSGESDSSNDSGKPTPMRSVPIGFSVPLSR